MRICEMFQEDVKVLAENRGMQQGLALGIEQGIEQGLELGRLQEKRDMVIKMLDKHMSIAIVSEITGMSEEQIRSFIH